MRGQEQEVADGIEFAILQGCAGQVGHFELLGRCLALSGV